MKATTPARSRSNVPPVCRLIVNADDYGHGAGVSAGIRAAHLNGIVSSTTAMMNQPDAGAELLRARAECPQLGLGVHLVLTMGAPLLPAAQVRSLLGYAGNFPKLAALQQHCAQIAPAELHAEWRAQIEAFLASGCAADHLDSHHHASYQHPLLLETMLQLAQEYHLPIRHPLDAGVPPQMPAAAQALLAQYRVPHPERLIVSFYGAGVTLKNLISIVAELPPGSSELMCHPGVVDAQLQKSSSYCAERGLELEYLSHARARGALEDYGVELITFAQL